MTRERDFSDEFLNAFVDNQLGVDEKSRVYARLNQDEGTKRQVCELRTMRDLVQLAYQDLPVSACTPGAGGRQTRVGIGIAAAIALAMGLAAGWALRQPATEDAATAAVAPAEPAAADAAARQPARAPTVTAAAPAVSAGPAPFAADEQITKVLVHYNSGRTAEASQILDDVEGMLRHYRAIGQMARIELIVNGEGINILRADTSPLADRILRMQQEYDNLSFIACQNTIDRLKREQGVIAKLLPGVVVIDSGVAQLMRRQHQGWAYIQA